jgi:hypothetical protein
MGQFYHVAVCNKRPYWVFGGLQDNGTWGGPSVGRNGNHGPINEDWVSIFGGDGYRCAVDANDPDLVYYEMQDGGMGRRHLKTGEQKQIGPGAGQKGKGKLMDKDAPKHRFNWNTPFILSHHNPKIFYCGGDFVFKSLDRGDNLKIISPELTVTKRGTATALAESPKNPDVLWAGTDDGNLWVTRDGGQKWVNVADKVGLPGPRWVSSIETSRKVEGRAYVCFDAHRSDDDKPYIFVTEDFGQNWKNISANLPSFGSTRVLREDVINTDLLYCGTEFGIFASINRGESWTKINNNLPTVAIHEIAVHPTAGEIVAATHGRSLWIVDVAGLRQITATTMKDKAHLYKPNTATRWQFEPAHGRTNRRFVGQNPPNGAPIYYSLAEPAKKVTFEVRDIEGTVLAKWTGSTKPGLNKTSWDMTRPFGDGPFKGDPEKMGGGKGGGKKGGGFFGQGRRFVAPGDYRIQMEVEGEGFNVTASATLRVEGDPNIPADRRIADDEEMPWPKQID